MLSFIYFHWLKLEHFTLTHFRLVYRTAPPAVAELDWTDRAAYAHAQHTHASPHYHSLQCSMKPRRLFKTIQVYVSPL